MVGKKNASNGKVTPPKMPKKKKHGVLKIVIPVVVLLALLVSCFGGSSEKSSSSSNTTKTSESTTTSSKEATIEEQVLYDQNNIKITATELETGMLGPQLKLTIENNGSSSVVVQARNTNVNGYMVDYTLSAEVAAGKKKNDELIFLTSGLKECGITEVATMEFNFVVIDPDTFQDIAVSDTIKIDTSIADEYNQTVDDSGNVLMDTNGIKIVEKGLSENDSFWGPGVILYIENNTGQNITVQVRDVSINGIMVTSTMSEDVVNGKKAISDIQFFSSDLEDNDIDKVEDVEFYFTIIDTSTFQTIFDSDVINLSYK